MSTFNFNVPKTSASTFPANAVAAVAPTPAFGSTGSVQPTPAFGGSFNFGATATATPTNSFGLNSAPTATPSFGLSAAPNTATSFGLNAASTATPSFGLGGGTSNPLMTTSSAPTFNFSKASTTAASLNFGTTTSSATSFAGFGKPLTAVPVATTTAAPFIGLGGVDMSQTQPKAGDPKPDNIKAKETQVPDEIVKTVDALKAHIKSQKTLASDIGRTSTSKLTSITSEAKSLLYSLTEIANAVESNYNQIKILRQETSKTMQSVEMAQRTQDTPTGLQYENVAPFQFFSNLVEKYEQDLINFQQQIITTEQHMSSIANPKTVTAEELKRGFKQINECFISLAGRLHELHQKVEAQKEQYLNLRKYRLRDSTNVFAELEKRSGKFDSSNISYGPTPFSNISAISSLSKTFNSAATAAAGSSNALPSVK